MAAEKRRVLHVVNEAREEVLRANPSLAKDLPPALQIDEIQVRQQVLEREQEQRVLSISR